MTTTPKNQEDSELNDILQQLQYGTAMSNNTEPMLTNNREVAEQALIAWRDKHGLRERSDEANKTRKVAMNHKMDTGQDVAIAITLRLQDLRQELKEMEKEDE